jgi:hypothetical protein
MPYRRVSGFDVDAEQRFDHAEQPGQHLGLR